jgi:predicted AlkP superfamily phosphohydrolase/phosphomutase
MVVSDHGGIPTHTRVALEPFFRSAGLASYRTNERGREVVDLEKSKVVLNFNYVTHNIWINLQGRDPSGVVPPEEYETVRNQVITLLTRITDPRTGECPIALALRREDARDLGQWGDRVGDVVYFFRRGYSNKFTNSVTGFIAEDVPETGFEPVLEGPEFGRHHSYLPWTTYCGCSVKGICIAAGPGIRPGYARPMPIHTVDIVPTACFLAGWPLPRQAEGMVPPDMVKDESGQRR